MKNKNFGRKRQAIYILSNRKSTRIIKTLMDFFFFIKVKIKMVCFSVPSAEVAEGRFFCFFFLVKKRKVLKVLWFWSALPTASQSTHFMNIKYSVLYFTWKWLPERAKMPHICAT